MMMKQRHDNNRIKRSAIQMHEDQVDGTEEESLQEETIKRRDQKATPVKALEHQRKRNKYSMEYTRLSQTNCIATRVVWE